MTDMDRLAAITGRVDRLERQICKMQEIDNELRTRVEVDSAHRTRIERKMDELIDGQKFFSKTVLSAVILAMVAFVLKGGLIP